MIRRLSKEEKELLKEKIREKRKNITSKLNGFKSDDEQFFSEKWLKKEMKKGDL